MDEEEPDFGTPIGKVIKHINTLCKKPKIDEQLSEALDLFKEKLHEQEKYLANGIFKINFSEAALFLQSSTELYGKKVDLLWDELLEFHTRLIKYDCEHQKEKGGTVDKEAIAKLEERRNRYKRRKKFKLVLKTSEKFSVTTLLFEEVQKEVKDPYEDEDYNTCIRTWRDLEYSASEMREIHPAIYRQMLKHYNLKNYIVLRSQDSDILDLEDDEFNTKWSRIPRWNHIWHFFEYNDEGLMPDHHSIIAKLRLCEYGRIRFVASKRLPFGTPFEKYKDEYLVYRKQFLEEDAKKWQNMPLDSLDDLRKQLAYLVQKDMEENGEIATDVSGTKPGENGAEDTSPTMMDKINLLENSDDDADSLFELSFTCDKDFMKSDLFVRLEKLSSDLINTKLRQDSGFFDFNSDSDNECDNASCAVVSNPEVTEGEPADANGESAGVINENGSDVDQVTTGDSEIAGGVDVPGNSEVTVGETGENVEKNQAGGLETDPTTGTDNADGNVDDTDDVRSYISDHDYCLTIPPALATHDETNVPTVTETNVPTVAEAKKDEVEQAACKKLSEPIFAIPRNIPKVIRAAHKKEKVKINDVKNDDQSPPKRRKLSAKQLEKLLTGKIKPVREQKFEKFFSMNYLPQMGEGDVIPVEDFDSGESDMEDFNDLPDDGNNLDQSANDDAQSVMSDHDYCQRSAEDVHNDSGFIDLSLITPPPDSDWELMGYTEAPVVVDEEAERRKREEQALYEKYLAALIESDKDQENIASWMSDQRANEEREIKAARTRVEEWRNHINPILKSLKENDFDIHEYGGKIMDNMEVKETKPFKDIVGAKSSAEVVRYFISSLQLANTNNVEICGALQGQLSNDTFGVKLLSRDRYHEHLQEYLAPSEETLREKLDRVRAMMAAENPPDSGEPPVKAPKLTAAMKETKTKARTYVKRTYTKAKARYNGQQAPSQKVKPTASETQANKSNAEAPQTATNEQVQDENNDSVNGQRAKSLLKGKSIIKRPAMSETSPNARYLRIHIDVTIPSTVRQYVNPYVKYPVDGEMPSTSTSAGDFHESPTSDKSSNKRRRDSDEDAFRERLLSVQETSPDVQMQSTPRGPPPPKQVKTSAPMQKSLLFE